MSEETRGRPQHEPTETTRYHVKMLAAFGNTERQIAMFVGITPPTLRKHYRAELRNGHQEANNAVAQNIFRQATKDDVRAFPWAKFWMNTRAGWSEYVPVFPKEPKLPKRGKKEIAQDQANAPDENTTMGELMVVRMRQTIQ